METSTKIIWSLYVSAFAFVIVKMIPTASIDGIILMGVVFSAIGGMILVNVGVGNSAPKTYKAFNNSTHMVAMSLDPNESILFHSGETTGKGSLRKRVDCYKHKATGVYFVAEDRVGWSDAWDFDGYKEIGDGCLYGEEEYMMEHFGMEGVRAYRESL